MPLWPISSLSGASVIPSCDFCRPGSYFLIEEVPGDASACLDLTSSPRIDLKTSISTLEGFPLHVGKGSLVVIGVLYLGTTALSLQTVSRL